MKDCRQCIWYGTCSHMSRCEHFEIINTEENEALKDYRNDMVLRMREYQKIINETAEEGF